MRGICKQLAILLAVGLACFHPERKAVAELTSIPCGEPLTWPAFRSR